MSLTWHIVRKDIRRFWIPLVLLSALAVLRFGVGGSLLTANEPDRVWFNHMAVYANVLWGIGLFVTFLLVAAVVQEDSLASPSFWQTRPISGARLLAAKAVGLTLMFGLLPTLVSVPWWLGCGLGWQEICGAAAETFAVQMGVVLIALPWAAVTGSYGRFLLWTLVGAVAWATVTLLLAGHIIGSEEHFSSGNGVTRCLAIGFLAIAGSIGVAAHQFVTRQTWRSIVLIVVAALAMAIAGRWWPWDASGFWSPRQKAPSGVVNDITLSFDDAWAYVDFSTPESNTVAHVNLHSTPVPSPYLLSPLYSQQNLRWPDGTVTRQAGFEMWGTSPMYVEPADKALGIVREPRDQSWLRYMERHVVARLADWSGNSNREAFERFPMVISPEMLKKFKNQKPKYDGIFWFQLLQPEVVGEHEIRPGSEFTKGSRHTRIASVKIDAGNQVLRLLLVERSPAFLLSEFMQTVQLAPWKSRPVYRVVNQKRTFTREGHNETTDEALISGVEIVLRNEGFTAHERWNTSSHRWEAQPDTFTGDTLAEVDYPAVLEFSLPLQVDNFPLHVNKQFNSNAPSIGRYSVKGDVNKVGEFELSQGTDLVSALRAAGGVTDEGDLKAVTLTRAAAGGGSSRLVVDIEAWSDGTLSSEKIPFIEPGDVVEVPNEKSGQRP
jgi:hypothetical protein